MNPQKKQTGIETLNSVLRAFLVCLALTSPFALAHSTQAPAFDPGELATERNVFLPDDRVAVTSGSYPWGAIGKLQTSDGSSCTATLVSKYVVLTAAHCVQDNGQLVALTYYPNQRWGKSATSSSARLTYRGTTDPQGDRTNDWALVVLNDNLGAMYGTLGVQPTTTDNFPNALMVVGYSYNFSNGDTASAATCHNQGAHYGMIYHDCDTAMGSSGGPVLTTFDNSTLTIVGVNVAEMRGGGNESLYLSSYSDNYANIAIPTTGLMSKLHELIDQGY